MKYDSPTRFDPIFGSSAGAQSFMELKALPEKPGKLTPAPLGSMSKFSKCCSVLLSLSAKLAVVDFGKDASGQEK